MNDIKEQIKVAEKAIKRHRAKVNFPDGGGAIEIDNITYKVPSPVLRLIQTAIENNIGMSKTIEDLKSHIIRSEIMRK